MHDAARIIARYGLAESDFLGRLDSGARSDLVAQAILRDHVTGDEIFGQDEQAHSFFLLLEGRLRVTRLTPEGQQVVVRFVVPGEVFGIARALGRNTYPATCTAVTPASCLVWPSVAWPRIMARHPELAGGTLETVGKRLQDMQSRVMDLSTERVEPRVAKAIIGLISHSSRKVGDMVEIDFPLNRQDIAEMTGTTLHTVSRILSAWHDEKLIRAGRRKVGIIDMPGLRRKAGET